MENEEWLTSRQIADKLKCNVKTVSKVALDNKIKTRKLAYHDVRYKFSDIANALAFAHSNQHNRRWIDGPTTKVYDDYWRLDWPEFVCACDTHSPHLNERLFNRMMEIAEKYKVKNFVHPGDFFDMNTFSRFDVEPEDIIDFEYEIGYSRKILKTLKQGFDDIRFSMGSHDVRFWLMMLRQSKNIAFDLAFKLTEVEGIKVSKFRYVEIGSEWRLTHPKNVVKVGGLPSIRLCAKFNRSIVFGHGHWWGMEFDPSGKHYLVAPGCLVDPKRIAYKNMWDTSHSEWKGGFLLVLDKDKPILFNENSPWEIYLK